jgi:hypothetical protein
MILLKGVPVWQIGAKYLRLSPMTGAAELWTDAKMIKTDLRCAGTTTICRSKATPRLEFCDYRIVNI